MSGKSPQDKSQFAQIEEAMVESWKKEKVFEASISNRSSGEHFEFYDGPPFANGLPHYGHLTSSIVKDAIPRYKTMRGYQVPRRFGWDCHGLPAEMKAEQDLDLGSKAAIEEYGVEKFIDYCRSSVTEFTEEWKFYVDRMGRWVDFDDNYYTMDQGYMESVMWAFKELWSKGLVSEGFKVMPYCHVCETSLSHFETRQDDSYRERTDPAVTVRFRLESGESLLAWTTTPWTLPANLAVAVNKDLDYAVYEGNGERLVLAPEAAERYEDELKDYKKIDTKKGSEFVGLKYEPPFDYFVGHKNAHQVIHADFVTAEDGTGIAHEAPGFGEDDQVVCEANGISVVVPVDKQGNYTDEITAYAGMNVFDANEHIVEALKAKNDLFKFESVKHSYPHCWRTDNPLIYRAVSSWMIDVPSMKQALQAKNQEINWIPSNVKDGAFGKWLEGVRVWNVSRDRYWGAPIPVWRTEDGSETLVIGSVEELKSLAVEPDKVIDLHKPAIDSVVLKTPKGKLAYRVPDVFDCWFESGSMPFAQHNYPFSNPESFKHPADFIVEYVGQVRGWFYTLHVLATALHDEPAFKNVISHGIILGSDGRKMSKRLGNYPDLQHVFDKYGADSLRFYLFESPLLSGETIAIDEKAIIDTHRNVFMTLWNSFRFFNTYAEVDKWEPPSTIERPQTTSLLDNWILSRLDSVTEEVTKQADAYLIPKAVRPLRLFIDDLSNWYIRRSRRRFWKSESDKDKQQAYATLWYVLVRLTQLMAPWSPFLSDKIYRELVKDTDYDSSVHLTDWPEAGKADSEIIEQMEAIRELISEGLSQRAEAGIKVRQPLKQATLTANRDFPDELVEMAKDELNVHKVKVETGSTMSVAIDTHIDKELELEGLMRDIIRQVQNARKKAGLKVEDRIELSLSSQSEKIMESIEQHKNIIQSETLATSISTDKKYDYSTDVKISSEILTVSLTKAGHEAD